MVGHHASLTTSAEKESSALATAPAASQPEIRGRRRKKRNQGLRRSTAPVAPAWPRYRACAARSRSFDEGAGARPPPTGVSGHACRRDQWPSETSVSATSKVVAWPTKLT